MKNSLPNIELIDAAIVTELTQRFGDTWEWDKTNRCWVSQKDYFNRTADVTLTARIRSWSVDKTPLCTVPFPRLPISAPGVYETEVTIEVFTNKMWGLCGLFRVDTFEVKDKQYYDESGHDSPINGPIDNRGECGMIP